MGVNAASAQPKEERVKTGLMTPARERSPAFSPASSSSRAAGSRKGSSRAAKDGLGMTSVISSPVLQPTTSTATSTTQLPPTPPLSQNDRKSNRRGREGKIIPSQEELETEFPDTFVTQVYNYLSLGYPVLARQYDEELARITAVEMETLRRDDPDPAAQSDTEYEGGFVGLPEGGAGEVKGERWKALRLYVWEWGRQQSGIWEDEGGDHSDEDGDGEDSGGKPRVTGKLGLGERDVNEGVRLGRKSSWGW